MSTINECLGWQKTLATRRLELVKLRDASATRTFQAERYTAQPTEGTVREPVYNALELDKTINRLAREERLVAMAIKRANATTDTPYTIDDKVLGELV